ncbi:hypothetical protein H4582DRAFT_1915146 [Lactarius indigo]|nr:hypothetical protein H4582DRAFT_1915146 [Lactarius indigo]
MTAKTNALYVHIHRLLDEHVAVHLTTNYIDYTQLRVYQVLTDGLHPVPAKDTHSLLPPSDPLDNLVQEHCHVEPQKTWERLSTVKGTQELIARTIGAVPFERTNFLDTFCTFSLSLYYDQETPVLTARTIRLTQRIGHSGVPCFIPVHIGDVPRFIRMELATDEGFGCNDVGVMNDHSRLAVDNDMLKEAVPLYQWNASSPAQRSGTEYSPSSASLYRTPSPALLSSSPQTPPLFSRSNTIPGKPAHVPIAMADLPLSAPLAMCDDDEGNPASADQWFVSTTSSPPPSSLDEGLREQGEIFAPSSDSRGPIDDLLAAKMDMVYVPREARVGGFDGVLNAPGQRHRLHEYIGAIIDLTPVSNATPASVPFPTDNITASLTPAPHVPTTPTPDNIWQHLGDMEDNPFCFLSGDFPKEVIDPDLFDWPEEIGLMDVPLLPSPNVHTCNVTWPSDLGSLTHETFSSFYPVKGIKSLNLELTWRPYSSEQPIPTLEGLVGVSDLHNFFANVCSDVDEDKRLLADLLDMSHPPTRPISIEDENQRGIEVIMSATGKSDSSTIGPASIDGFDANVLLTRAERCQYRSLYRPHQDRDRGYTGQWEVRRCNPQLHISKKVIIGGLEESVYCREGTSCAQLNSVGTGLSTHCHPPFSGSLGDKLEITADLSALCRTASAASSPGSGDAFAHHVQLPAGLAATVPPASLFQDPVLITDLEASGIPGPSRSHSYEGHEVDSNYLSSAETSPQSTVHDEQSLGGYLTILSKKCLPGPSHDIPLTPPTFSEKQRVSPPLSDVEQLLWELTNLTAPIPPMQAPPLRDHRYLASVELLQNRPLMCALRRDWLCIDLLEREWLNGADLVFDCDTALVFSRMCLLPSDSRSLKGRLGSLSWKYTRLAIVFKLYDDGVSGLQYSQTESGQEGLSARVIRSFEKLRRDIAIAEACGEKRPQTDLQMYFARSDEHAATVVRTLGDITESQSQWCPWGDRLWLRADEQEEESYLASVDGMNAFAAAAILSQISLHEFLALSSDQRFQLAQQIPLADGMIERFNEAIAQRREGFNIYVGSEDGDEV